MEIMEVLFFLVFVLAVIIVGRILYLTFRSVGW
jgi:hypothetical protein